MASSSTRHRRLLLDMIVPDWDEAFLSRYDPVAYARMVADTGVDSVMVYAQSHVGLTYWPSSTGHRHPALGGRDWFGDTIRVLHARGVHATAYYSVIFNNRAAEEHPDWAMVKAAPLAFGPLPGRRYELVCPNNIEYRAFAEGQVREIAANYEIDGFFLDMAFWPSVCQCPACEGRSIAELGRPIPETVNWNDPGWTAFQRARERWLCEFTATITEAIRDIRHGLPVYHNSAIILGNWVRGYSFDMAGLSSFLGGDFYGGRREQALIGRLLARMTRERPAEFMTTVRNHLVDHEELRSIDELEMIALSAIAKGAAIRYIDPVDPIGTVNAAAYTAVAGVFERIAQYGDVIGGEPIGDVAVYVSDFSKASRSENGKALALASASRDVSEHLRAAAGAVLSLESHHYCVDVVTRMNLEALTSSQVLIVPDAEYLGEEEVIAIRDFVSGGGNLYASGFTSLKEGAGNDGFALGDLFGCTYHHEEAAPVVYAVPKGADLPASIAPARMATCRRDRNADGATPIVRAGHDADVLATLSFPYSYGASDTGPAEAGQWSSIHSDPPWHNTTLPAVLRHQFGAGTVIYSACDLESQEPGTAGSELFVALVADLHGGSRLIEINAPPWVSIGLFHQSDEHRYVVTLLSYPRDLPAQPIASVACRMRLPETAVTGVSLRETGEQLEFTRDGTGTIALVLPLLDRLAVLLVTYE